MLRFNSNRTIGLYIKRLTAKPSQKVAQIKVVIIFQLPSEKCEEYLYGH
ncbi:hypothetical protein SAG0060_02245 [Streptococcus agalactiae CCUG 37737]|nr:hypothetical protein SAG0060_02245 [Streptococcus agalactiae CCUG 37737]